MSADIDMDVQDASRAESIQQQFQAYSGELDVHFDRRERIIKTSRDTTALSKKLIFLLHRVTQRKPASVLNEARPKLEEIRQLLASLQDDLEGESYWRLVAEN